jgi:DNA mismatch endonuclease, patch repair protein
MALPYPSPTSTTVSQLMRANRKIGTRPEALLRSALHHRGLRFRKALLIDVGVLKVRPDVVFTKAHVAAFMDGCFWHSCPEHGTSPNTNSSYWLPKLRRNVERDVLVNEALVGAGWTVIRVWEHDVRRDIDNIVARIAAALTPKLGGRAMTSIEVAPR